jgi:hypothetical protein
MWAAERQAEGFQGGFIDASFQIPFATPGSCCKIKQHKEAGTIWTDTLLRLKDMQVECSAA